jgi:hypothetical protein
MILSTMKLPCVKRGDHQPFMCVKLNGHIMYTGEANNLGSLRGHVLSVPFASECFRDLTIMLCRKGCNVCKLWFNSGNCGNGQYSIQIADGGHVLVGFDVDLGFGLFDVKISDGKSQFCVIQIVAGPFDSKRAYINFINDHQMSGTIPLEAFGPRTMNIIGFVL